MSTLTAIAHGPHQTPLKLLRKETSIHGTSRMSLNSMSSSQTKRGFNQDISGWDVSNGTTFKELFRQTAFNQDISAWDVSNGTKFNYMFYYATAFNQSNIEIWTPSNDADFSAMFSSAHADMIAKFGATPTIDLFHYDPNTETIDARDFDTMVSENQVVETADSVTLNSSYFAEFSFSDNTEEKKSQTKKILRKTLSRFSDDISNRKVVVNKDDLTLPHTFTKQNCSHLEHKLFNE